MTHKGKRAYIPPEAEEIILTSVLEYPRLKRTPLAEKLQQELQSKNYDVPEIEVLERKISKYRKIAPADPQDKPWAVLSIAKNDIKPEALPTVLRLQATTLKEGKPLTIREALWVSRLYYIFKNVTIHDDSGRVLDVEKELLLLEARQYALEERKLKILADTFPDKEKAEKWLQWYADAILYYFATGDLETVKTTAKELIGRNILTEEEFTQWLQLNREKVVKHERIHRKEG